MDPEAVRHGGDLFPDLRDFWAAAGPSYLGYATRVAPVALALVLLLLVRNSRSS